MNESIRVGVGNYMGGVIGRGRKMENDVIIISKERNTKNNKMEREREQKTPDFWPPHII